MTAKKVEADGVQPVPVEGTLRNGLPLCDYALQALARGPNNADAVAQARGNTCVTVRCVFSELAGFKAIERTGLAGRSVLGHRQGLYALSAGPLRADAPASLRRIHSNALKLAQKEVTHGN